MDFKKLIYTPNIFEQGKSQEEFWDNDHISKMMLYAHLNPKMEAASRKPGVIKKTCDFVVDVLQLKNEKVLDLGCGPGLYAEIFCRKGLQVTGIDYSRRSITYAMNSAEKKGLKIEYIHQDYKTLSYTGEFDVAMIIYCDFGVLSQRDRVEMLQRIYKALKPGGYFVFDVWTKNHKELKMTYKDWFIHEERGFWIDKPHLELVNKVFYEEELVSLKQHYIIESDKNRVINLWEQCYTVESITDLLSTNGFRVEGVTGDLTGKIYDETSPSIAVIAKKV